MKPQDLALLYDYNYWANDRLLSAATALSRDQFAAPRPYGRGGLRGTLVHTLDGEYGWRMLCQHGQMTFDLLEDDFPSLDVLVGRWREEEDAMRAYVGSLSEDDLQGTLRYVTPEGVRRERVLWHCLLHAARACSAAARA